MDIKVTSEQEKEFLEDKWVNIIIGDYKIYLELTNQDDLFYFELIKSKNGKTEQGYAHDVSQLELLIPKRLRDPSWYHNDPLCPNCGTYMIYNFEHCPKCGQKIDYSNE